MYNAHLYLISVAPLTPLFYIPYTITSGKALSEIFLRLGLYFEYKVKVTVFQNKNNLKRLK